MSEDGNFEQVWRRRFERFADQHDDDAGIAGWSESGLAARFRRFVTAWQSTATDAARVHWLDAGCGAGTYTRFLAQQRMQPIAVDYSVPTVLKARARATADLGWAAADVTKLPFTSAAFDGALCFGVMQALTSPHAALRELRRVLKEGGELWVDCLNGRCLPSALAESRRRRRGQPAHLRYDDPHEFRAALAAAGFAKSEVYWVPIMPSRLRSLQPVLEASGTRKILAFAPPLAAATSHSLLFRARVPG